ncbi:hypothetical protein [Haloactinomyces albus]|uniref:Uncharacterized protein n=1 Tax=Haloactinomyces albus TaxID=1352928 RepID=A0AAE3ZAM3_9ACTN|nr:hypothetical protein [Haloactinomyces albus]MDR7301386.1 hypothetical protein [Haloactinomyces albus]
MTDRRDGNQHGSSPDNTGHHRARKLTEVFGDILPETTSDDRVVGENGESESERWYHENRPPHHGS